MNINRNDLCPCGSGKKYKNCCYEKKEENAKSLTEMDAVDLTLVPNPPVPDFLEHAERLKKIREENKENPNYPSGSIGWEAIEKIREENKENPNYPHVYWIDNEHLYVKVGEIEKEGITVSEAIELFKDNKLFMDELKYLLKPLEFETEDNEYSHNSRL